MHLYNVILALFGGIAGVVWFGAGLVQSGEIHLADLFTFILYTTFIGASISGMGDLYAQINKTVGASERLFEILEEPAEITIEESASVNSNMITGNVSYQNIHFSYPSRSDLPVLKGISFDIKAGEKVIIKAGPFIGMLAETVSIHNKQRLILRLDNMGIAIEINTSMAFVERM